MIAVPVSSFMEVHYDLMQLTLKVSLVDRSDWTKNAACKRLCRSYVGQFEIRIPHQKFMLYHRTTVISQHVNVLKVESFRLSLG